MNIDRTVREKPTGKEIANGPAPIRRLSPRSEPGANVVWVGVNALLICCLLLLTACSTASGPAGEPRRYSETQLGRNVFAVRVHETPHASNLRTTEWCLLRYAEVTLAYGFRHFVVLDSANEPEATTMDGLMLSPTHPGGLGLSIIDPGARSPSSANTIACFRKQPAGYPEAYDAEAVFSQLSGRYHVQKASEPRANPIAAAPLQFRLYPSYLLLPKTTPDQIMFLEPGATQRTIVIGLLNDWENPCETLDEFKRKAAMAAAILGGQAVQIQSERGGARRGGSADFVAALLLVPKARLGLLDEGGRWPREELVVRGFDKESLAPGAGLKVGDHIVALNGLDVRQEKRFVDGWLSWSVGETVVVTFVRDGIQMSLQANTIAN